MAFKKSVGLDIADHTIEILELSRGFVGAVTVSAAGRMSLSPGVVSNGRIINAEALKAALQKLFSQAKPAAIVADEICFGLPDSQIYTRVFALPPHHPNDLESLVLQEAINSIPIDEDNLNYSYKVLHETPAGTEILLAAADGEVIKEWHDFFVDLKIKNITFDLEPLALARGLLLKDSGTTMILDIGSATTSLFIFSDGNLAYSRSLIVAGDYLTKKISLDLQISLAEAEEQKVKFGLSYPDNKVVNPIMDVLKEISLKAKESINYFEERKKTKVTNFILVGGTSQMFGLLEYVKAELKLPGIIGQMKFDDKVIPLLYVESAGLALRLIDDKYKDDLKISFTPNKVAPALLPQEELVIAASESYDNGESNEEGAQILKSLTPPPVKEEKVKSKLLLLVDILIVGVVLIGLSWQYRTYNDKKQALDLQASIVQHINLQTLNTKIEVSTIGLENTADRVLGRVVRVTVASSTDLATAENTAKDLLAPQLNSGEKYFREPINRDTLLNKLEFPVIFEWLVYDQRSYLAIVNKRLESINPNKIPADLNGAELIALNKTASQDVFSFDCRISFYANETLK
ncbi:MAG: pilus assembly protein PilM [Candidatus Falkowbacteria bacterium]